MAKAEAEKKQLAEERAAQEEELRLEKEALAAAKLEKLRLANEEGQALAEAEAEMKLLAEQRAAMEATRRAEKDKTEARRAEMEREHALQMLAMEEDAKALKDMEEETRRLAEQRAEMEAKRREQREAIERARSDNVRMMEEAVKSEEEKLAAMESLQKRSADLVARREGMDKERRASMAAAAESEAQLREEAEYIERLERETSELAAKRAALEEKRKAEAAKLAAASAATAQYNLTPTQGGRPPSPGGSPNDASPSAGAPGGLLKSKRSLYDMIGGDAPAPAGEGVTRTIYPLTENDQTDIDQTDVDEPSGGGASKKKFKHTWANGEHAEEADEAEGEGGGDEEGEDDMPEFHDAAANGHVTTLAALYGENSDIIYEADGVGRNALFYACANDQLDCAQFLMSRAADSCATADENGDTPLHAAVSTGALGCCRLLLASSHCDPERANALGMRPAHLVKDRGTLELLCSHGPGGVELNCEDTQQRTPLFVACAIDRSDVVEFLCEIMDNEEDMNHVDRRGDTPLHAAACNGAVKSLTLLLQLGTNPDVRNKKGYRPIDLAARRGHVECENLLSEYHMHHSAGSYFDSVLFLATLQGHKACKEALQNTDEDSQYEIIKRSNPEATDDEIRRMGSLWSMRRSQSMRLQQYGSWIAYEDPKVGSVFW